MKSRTTPQFRKLFAGLPAHVQQQAREAYQLFRDNHDHPGLHFKKIFDDPPTFSARRYQLSGCGSARRRHVGLVLDRLARRLRQTARSALAPIDLQTLGIKLLGIASPMFFNSLT